jgi:hypothetical protein
MKTSAIYAALAVFNGILAIVLMTVGVTENNTTQKIIGFINAVTAPYLTYIAITNLSEN